MAGTLIVSAVIAFIAAALMFAFSYFETYRHFEKSDKRLRISLQNGLAMSIAAFIVVSVAAYLLLRFSGV